MFLGGVGRLMRALASGTTFSPIDLFASGAPGVWYDPSDLTTLYQDAAGTTPVTAVEQPVGLRLDKSRGLVLGSELVTNGGPFTATTGWTTFNSTLSVVSSKLRVTNTAVAGRALWQLSTVAGRFYRIAIKITNVSGSGPNVFSCRFSNNSDGSSGLGGIRNVPEGTYTFYIAATATTTYFYIRNESIDQVWEIESVSLKELPGSHAFQTTDINRPVLSARYNLLTRTEQFDNAAWTKTNATISANTTATTDPLGGNTADKLLETAATDAHFVQVAPGVVVGTTYTLVFHAKAAERSWCGLFGGGKGISYFDLANGVTGTTAANTTTSITALGGGWYRCTYTATAANTTNTFGIVAATADNTSSYAGNTANGIYIWGADLRVSNDGVGLPAYQRVTTATDYDTTGFPLYLRYNGTNSTMQTAAIDFTSTAAMSVFAGVRKLSDAVQGVVAELSASVSTNNGSFLFDAPPGANARYRFISKGTVLSDAETTDAYASPTTNIVTGLGNISGDSTILRINGAQIAAKTTDQGTGTFGNYPLYLGARAGSSLWANIRDYGLIVLGRTATATEIANTEAWLNGKTAAYGPPTVTEILTRSGDTILTRAGDTIIARAN